MINRNNYEEFFLLYTDNELTPEQRKSVEIFVQQNPDLEEEFVMLQQLKLTPDEAITFGEKESLYRTGDHEPINLSNYEEYLILYIDNELTEKERKETELFAEKHPQVKKELEIYLKTKLEPEAGIVFPEKESLYRKDKAARVVTLRWMRIAAAAVVVLALGITAILLLNQQNNTADSGFASVPSTPATIEKDINENNISAAESGKKSDGPTDVPVITLNDKKENKFIEKKSTGEKEIELKNDVNNSSLLASNDIGQETTINTQPSLSLTKLDRPVKTLEPVTQPDPALLTEFNNGPVTTTPSYALNIINAADEDGNKKSRGLFRKATRFFERTTNIDATTDDNKLLIGSFAINLK